MCIYTRPKKIMQALIEGKMDILVQDMEYENINSAFVLN
jgi:hypothetical protein